MTSSGVPVGDTTLLQRLKELDEQVTRDWELAPRAGNAAVRVPEGSTGVILGTWNAENAALIVEARNALPAVVTLIQAAQTYRKVIDAEPHIGASGYELWETDYLVTRDALDAALAPFVSEAAE